MKPDRIPFLDLARQSRSIRTEIGTAIDRVVDRGWFVLGQEGTAFEAEFASFCGVSQAVGVNSGTDALTLALLACGIQAGDGVLTAANTAVPTICAILAANAVPVLVDIDLTTYNLDPNSLRDTLSHPRSSTPIKAVIPVHLYGRPAAMDDILEIAREFDLRVVEDASQAHGACFQGRAVGTMGDVGCFSFYPTKNLGALGDAGIAVTNSAGIAERMRMLRNYGEESKYRNRMIGVNSRLDEIQAAVLRCKLPHLDEWVVRRRQLARRYDEGLGGTSLILPQSDPKHRHSYHLYVVRSPNRDELRQRLSQRGIDTAVHYPLPVHFQEAHRALGHGSGSFPNSERAAREVLSIPLFPELCDDEVERVVEAIRLESAKAGE